MAQYIQHDLEAYITEALAGFAEEHDIEAIIDELHENGITNGEEAEEYESFWEIVEKHAK